MTIDYFPYLAVAENEFFFIVFWVICATLALGDVASSVNVNQQREEGLYVLRGTREAPMAVSGI